MGHLKEFAIWLAKCIHIDKMKDEEILNAAKGRYRFTDEDYPWLKEQIQVVNADPFYIRLAQRGS